MAHRDYFGDTTALYMKWTNRAEFEHLQSNNLGISDSRKYFNFLTNILLFSQISRFNRGIRLKFKLETPYYSSSNAFLIQNYMIML